MIQVRGVEVQEIAPDVFRINTLVGDKGENVACFLVRDEQPALIETSIAQASDQVLEAVSQLIDVSTLRYVFIPYFAMDEVGGLNQFLELAPQAEPVCSPPGMITLSDYAIRRPRMMRNGDKISLGSKTIVGVLTPHVPAWDSMMFFEETEGILFSSDLFVQQGGALDVTDADCTEEVVAFARRVGAFPSKAFLDLALDRIDAVSPKMIACMHGPILTGDVARYSKALREKPITEVLDAMFLDMAFPVAAEGGSH